MTKLECRHCGRYIGEAETIVAEIKCPNSSCRAGNQFKILSNAVLVDFKFDHEPDPPKNKKKVDTASK